MLNIVIFGAPGSGKGTYSARLVDTFKLDHISTGDVLRGEKISAMINLEVSEDILMARLLRRATLEGRADDNEETIKKRFAVYHNQTAPLIEWFKGEGVFKGFTYTDEIGLEGMVKNITEYVNTIV